MNKKVSKISIGITALIYILACGYIGYCMAQCADVWFNGNYILTFAAVLPFWAAVIILHIIMHELGHFVFGRLTGYSFKSFRIFNLMWQKDSDGKIRLYKFSIAGTAGQCLMVPPELKDGDMPYVLYNLGGVAFNLLLAAVGMAVSALFPASIAELYGKIICVMGITLALENGLPLPGITNDGGNLLSLSKSKEARRSLWIQMMGVLMLAEGKRVRAFPSEWFNMPDDLHLKNRMEAVMAVYVCNRLIDEHNFEDAQQYIDSLMNKKTAIVQIHMDLLKTDALFCELIGNCDPQKVEAYATNELISFWKTMQTHPSVIRTQYAYQKIYKKDARQAAKAIELFEKCSKTYPYPCEVTAERELIAIADEKSDVSLLRGAIVK